MALPASWPGVRTPAASVGEQRGERLWMAMAEQAACSLAVDPVSSVAHSAWQASSETLNFTLSEEKHLQCLLEREKE